MYIYVCVRVYTCVCVCICISRSVFLTFKALRITSPTSHCLALRAFLGESWGTSGGSAANRLRRLCVYVFNQHNGR